MWKPVHYRYCPLILPLNKSRYHGMACPHVVSGGWPPLWRVAMNILNKQSRTTDKGWSSNLGGGGGGGGGGWTRCLQLLTVKRALLQNGYVPQAWPDPFLPTKEWKRDMRFSTWNVSSL